MKNSATLPFPGRCARWPALAGTAVLAAACASGAGAPPVTGAEAEALFGDLAGVWVLDEFGSSGQIATPARRELRSFVITKSGGRGHIIRGAEGVASPGIQEATYEVLRRRPEILTLLVDSAKLVYMPVSGRDIEVPMNGQWVGQTEGEWEVRTRVFWDDGRLGLEHEVASKGWVTEVLEVVNGRLEMTREIHRVDEPPAPIVLVYDRDEEGG